MLVTIMWKRMEDSRAETWKAVTVSQRDGGSGWTGRGQAHDALGLDGGGVRREEEEEDKARLWLKQGHSCW